MQCHRILRCAYSNKRRWYSTASQFISRTLGVLSTETNDPLWGLLVLLKTNNAPTYHLTGALKNSGVPLAEYNAYAHRGLHNLPATVPPWTTLHLLSAKVTTPTDAYEPLVWLLHQIPVYPPHLQAAALIFSATHLAHWNMVVPLRMVVDAFLELEKPIWTPRFVSSLEENAKILLRLDNNPAYDLYFNLFLRALTHVPKHSTLYEEYVMTTIRSMSSSSYSPPSSRKPSPLHTPSVSPLKIHPDTYASLLGPLPAPEADDTAIPLHSQLQNQILSNRLAKFFERQMESEGLVITEGSTKESDAHIEALKTHYNTLTSYWETAEKEIERKRHRSQGRLSPGRAQVQLQHRLRQIPPPSVPKKLPPWVNAHYVPPRFIPYSLAPLRAHKNALEISDINPLLRRAAYDMKLNNEEFEKLCYRLAYARVRKARGIEGAEDVSASASVTAFMSSSNSTSAALSPGDSRAERSPVPPVTITPPSVKPPRRRTRIRTDRHIQPTLETYTIILQGLILRKSPVAALKLTHFLFYRSGLLVHTWHLVEKGGVQGIGGMQTVLNASDEKEVQMEMEVISLGIKVMMMCGRIEDAFKIIENVWGRPTSASLPSALPSPSLPPSLAMDLSSPPPPPVSPTYIPSHILPSLMHTLRSLSRPDIVLYLWDTMYAIFQTLHSPSTLSLMLQSARRGAMMEERSFGRQVKNYFREVREKSGIFGWKGKNINEEKEELREKFELREGSEEERKKVWERLEEMVKTFGNATEGSLGRPLPPARRTTPAPANPSTDPNVKSNTTRRKYTQKPSYNTKETKERDVQVLGLEAMKGRGYTGCLWRGGPPEETARQVFLQVMFGMDLAISKRRSRALGSFFTLSSFPSLVPTPISSIIAPARSVRQSWDSEGGVVGLGVALPSLKMERYEFEFGEGDLGWKEMFRWVEVASPSAGLDHPLDVDATTTSAHALDSARTPTRRVPLPHYPHLALTDANFFDYLLLLSVTKRTKEVALTMAWMKHLGVRPSEATLALSMVLWGEVSVEGPFVEGLSRLSRRRVGMRRQGGKEENAHTRGEPANEYERFVFWIEEWVGEDRVPAEHVLRRFRMVVKNVREEGGVGAGLGEEQEEE